MEFSNLINRLLTNESDKMKHHIFSLLLKYSDNVSVLSERNDDFLPLFFIKDNSIGLIYSDDNFNGFQYIFTNYEEILIILQKHLSEGKTLFFYYSGDLQESEQEIVEKINFALSSNDKESFDHYSKLLIDRRK